MSHCTHFKFQYVDVNCIAATYSRLKLSPEEKYIRSYSGMKWLIEEYPTYMTFLPTYNVVHCKNKGFNYFMENCGNHHELSIEKHDMTETDKRKSKQLASEFQTIYIEEVAKLFVDKMCQKGINAILNKEDKGFSINFGPFYEKSILIKFDNGRVIEEVHGVKGESCVSLTEALENMLSSADVELNSEWTEEYYEGFEEGLAIYNLTENEK